MNAHLIRVALLVLLVTGPAWAQDGEVKDTVPSSTPWEVSVKGGTSIPLNGQSNALPHRFRYTIRAELAYQLTERFQLGTELVLPASFEKNYRMIGGFVNAKVGIYLGEIYQFKMLGGFGLGTGPKILSTELNTEEPLRLWYQVAMQHRWTVVRDLMDLGLDISFENLSVISANVAIQFRF